MIDSFYELLSFLKKECYQCNFSLYYNMLIQSYIITTLIRLAIFSRDLFMRTDRKHTEKKKEDWLSFKLSRFVLSIRSKTNFFSHSLYKIDNEFVLVPLCDSLNDANIVYSLMKLSFIVNMSAHIQFSFSFFFIEMHVAIKNHQICRQKLFDNVFLSVVNQVQDEEVLA
jgi:hypothetical protein